MTKQVWKPDLANLEGKKNLGKQRAKCMLSYLHSDNQIVYSPKKIMTVCELDLFSEEKNSL